MALRANSIFLLLFGFIFLVNNYSTPVVADLSSEQNIEIWDHGQLKPRQNTIQVEKIDDEDEVKQTGTETNILKTENKENNFSLIKKRGLVGYGGVDIDSLGNKAIGWPLRARRSGRVEINDNDGLKIRATNFNNYQTIKLKDNKILMGGNVMCNDIHNLDDEVTYQKSFDGTFWHTNIKVGKPMTPVEIKEFEKDWAQNKEGSRLKEVVSLQGHEKQGETEKPQWAHQEKGKATKMQLEDENSRKWLKQHDEEKEMSLKKQENQAENGQTESHKELSEGEAEKAAGREKRLYEDPLEVERSWKQRGLAPEKKQTETEGNLRETHAEMESHGQKQERQMEQSFREKDLQTERERRQKNEFEKHAEEKNATTEQSKQRAEGEKGLEEIEPEHSIDEYVDNDDDDETNFTIGNNSYTMTGRNLQLKNYKGVRFQVTSPYQKQNIVIKDNIVTVNDRVVCGDIRRLSNKQTYQMTDDGAEWYTNLKVGRPMTEEEIQQYQADKEERQTELEEKRKKRTAEQKQRQEARERQLLAIEEEEEMASKEIEAEKARIRETKEAGKERIRREKELAKERIRQQKREAKERLRKETQKAKERLRKETQKAKEKVRQLEAAQKKRIRQKAAAMQMEKEPKGPQDDYDY